MVPIDYSVYLVTGREFLPPGKDYYESLEESLQGGVTVVQIREKNTDTAEFIEVAAKSKEICDRYKVPILINDRIDVALAINAHGVHVGQSDMSVSQARNLLPKDTIIGVSCNNANEARQAVKDGVDYIGIGSVWGTKSKQLTNPLVRVRGVGQVLQVLDGTSIKAVAIGGIKSTNLLRTLHGCVSPTDHPLDGVAVISDIVASSKPREAAQKLSKIYKSFRVNPTPSDQVSQGAERARHLVNQVARLMVTVRDVNPLVHQITNTVVATQSANVTLAIGGSPIMANEAQEMEDIGGICSAVLLNIGTLRSQIADSITIAGRTANANKKPVVFDPVGVGASAFRRETVNDLLNDFQASVIKGNAGELAALANSNEVSSKGVDSVGAGFKDPVSFVKALAKKERCVVAMTGKVDYISDGTITVALKNGHELLGKITGSGCIAGTSIATLCGAIYSQSKKEDNGTLVHGDMLLGAIAGILVLTVAAQIVADRQDVKGPGTFLPALIDELGSLQPGTVQSLARVEVFP